MSTNISPRSQIAPLLRLGLPLVGGQVAQASIQIVDTAMLGRYNLEVLAGVGLGTALWFTLFIVGSGFAWAVTPLVAAAGDDTTRIRRVARMGLWASMGYAALVLPLLIYAEPILLAMGQPAKQSAIAGEYLGIAGWGLFPALAVMLMKSYLAGMHRTGVVLWVTLMAVALNTGLNWVLIFGELGAPEMGARGAALASALTHCAMVAALVVYAGRCFPDQALFARLWRPDWAELGQVFRLGWPIGVATMAETSLFTAATIMMGWIGVAELAAHGIALQLAIITFNFHIGISQAATVLAGTAFARSDWSRLLAVGLAALMVSGCVAVLGMSIMFAIPETLIGLFTDHDDPMHNDILVAGVALVMMAGLFQFADGAQIVLISLLRGMQDTRVPMFLTVISYWGVGVPLAYGLGVFFGFGGVGVWAGLVGGLTCAAVLLGLRFRRCLKQAENA